MCKQRHQGRTLTQYTGRLKISVLYKTLVYIAVLFGLHITSIAIVTPSIVCPRRCRFVAPWIIKFILIGTFFLENLKSTHCSRMEQQKHSWISFVKIWRNYKSRGLGREVSTSSCCLSWFIWCLKGIKLELFSRKTTSQKCQIE